MKQRLCLFFMFLLTACQSAIIIPTATLSPTHIVNEATTSSPIPTATITPGPTPTVDQLIYPYTVDGLHQHVYQNGKIHIRSTLEDKNQFYTSYLIDYPSDGLTITGVMHIPVGDGPFPVIVMNH